MAGEASGTAPLETGLRAPKAKVSLVAAPNVRRSTSEERSSIEALLIDAPITNGDGLARLDPANASRPTWLVAWEGRRPVAVAVLSAGLRPFQRLYSYGSSEGIGAILRDGVKRSRLTFSPIRPVAATYYRFDRGDELLRMSVTPRTFRPDVSGHPVRLRTADLPEIFDLYGPLSRLYFSPERLERELYFGVREAGRLVSAAGTDIRSHEYGIAIIARVRTRRDVRGRGYATWCTSAAVEAALAEHPLATLTVLARNRSAIGIYERLGFAEHERFMEGPGYGRPIPAAVAGALLPVRRLLRSEQRRRLGIG